MSGLAGPGLLAMMSMVAFPEMWMLPLPLEKRTWASGKHQTEH